jgi:glycerophosphoryl diester phosphodiesterase
MRRQPPLTVAHGYGNRRRLLEQALAEPVDYIEADIWFRGGCAWVRHERRFGFLPVLYDRRGSQPGPLGPLAVDLGPWYARLDTQPLSLEELLAKTKGRCGLLLDMKGSYSATGEDAFAATLASLLAEYGMAVAARICGQNWAVLQKVRQAAPRLMVQLSIETPQQWQAFLRWLKEDDPVTAICLHRSLMNEERARWLAEKGIQVFSWTVDQQEEAQRLLSLGVMGIISNNLALLGRLQALGSPTVGD